MNKRSRCPISFALDVFGDRWSLLILRDIFFRGKKFYKDFFDSPEGISTNILADRLQRLENWKILSKHQDTEDKKRFIYRPTERGLDLLPLIVEMILWGEQHDSQSGAPAEILAMIRKDKQCFIQKIRKNLEQK